MPDEHARLSPSGAHRWLSCPGSVEMCANIVDADSDASKEGTACHEVLQLLLEGKAVPEQATNGVKITKEMLRLVEPVYEWVIDYKKTHKAVIYSEQKVEIGAPAFGLKPGLCFGTADVVGQGDELLIADAKFGYVFVNVKENKQLILYALGVMYGSGWMYDTIRLVILQPQVSDEPSEVVYTGAELMKFEAELAPKIATAAQGGPLVPSEDACKWCRAAGACPALQEHTLQLARKEFSSALTMTPVEIADLLKKSIMIENAIKAVRLHATKLAETGTVIPGFKLVQGEKKRTWINAEGAPKKLKGLKLSEDQIFERKLAAPASIEAELADRIKAKSKEKITKKYAMEQAKVLLADLVIKPAGLPTLVEDGDERPALGPAFTEEEIKALDAAQKPVADEDVFD